MANVIKQTVTQINIEGINERFIVQYLDDQTEENKQNIVDYSSLNESEKQIFDNYKALCESKMV